MMPSEEFLRKLTGDFTDEGIEAGYRLVAGVLVEDMAGTVIDKFVTDEPIKTFLKRNKHLEEAVVSFVLAALMEFGQMPKLGDKQKRLAYNLRVQSYEKLGKPVALGLIARVISLISLVEDHADRACNLINGDARLRPQTEHDGGHEDQPAHKSESIETPVLEKVAV